MFVNNNYIQVNNKIIQELNLSKYNYGRLAYILLIQFCNLQQGSVDNLKPPTICNMNKSDTLILTHNSALCLEVIPPVQGKNKCVIDSLFAIMRHTCTNLGTRCLEHQLLNPMCSKVDIEHYYNMVEECLIVSKEEKIWISIEKKLLGLPDIARLQRKVELKQITPRDIVLLFKSYNKITELCQFLQDLDVPHINSTINKSFNLQEFKQFVTKFNNQIDYPVLECCDYDKLNNNKVLEFTTNPFKTNEYFINQFAKLEEVNSKLEHIQTHLNSFLTKGHVKMSTKPFNKQGKLLKSGAVKYDNKSTMLLISPTDANKLLTCPINIEWCGKIIISAFDTKHKLLTSDIITNLLQQKDNLTKDIGIKLTEYTNELVYQILSYAKFFTPVCNIIGLLDVIHTFAKLAEKNKYYRPRITHGDASYLKLKNLRHPIAEKLIEGEYITNDINIGKSDMTDDAPFGLLMYGTNSVGKCFNLYTKLIMHNGTVKLAKDIIVGDKLMGDDSTPRNVLSTTRGVGVMYKIIPTKGEEFIVNGSHILCLKSSGYKHITFTSNKYKNGYSVIWFNLQHEQQSKLFTIRKNESNKGIYGDRITYNTKEEALQMAQLFYDTVETDKDSIIEISVEEYIKKSVNWKINYYLYKVGVEFNKQEVTINPYILGYWLGDGTNSYSQITTENPEVVEYFKQYAESIGLQLKPVKNKNLSYNITSGTKKGKHGRNVFLTNLRSLNVMSNKHIPDVYKFNSRDVRLKLLAGLIDADGYNNQNKGFDITLKDKQLLEDIIWLVRSLGFAAYFTECQKTCTNAKDGPKTGTYYRTYIAGELLQEVPLLINYKIPIECHTSKRDPMITSFKIEKLEQDNYVGFETDGNKRFLLNDFTVTHNSTILKGIGLITIMAQSGCFVPADMVYSPYHNIITRLSTTDNLSQGQSSFEVEMNELKTILTQSAKNTLVFADELASKTESHSAACITVAAIQELLALGVSFLFTSHIHNIVSLPHIASLPSNIFQIYHLAVNYDTETENLIYNRKLLPGSGSSRYGINVAKYLKLPQSFIDKANEVSMYIEQQNIDYLNTKSSHFNSKVYMDHCVICNATENLETHHIQEQKYADDQGYINHMHKNVKSNLLVLCEKCHRKITIEKKELEVLQTINGHIVKYKHTHNDIL